MDQFRTTKCPVVITFFLSTLEPLIASTGGVVSSSAREDAALPEPSPASSKPFHPLHYYIQVVQNWEAETVNDAKI